MTYSWTSLVNVQFRGLFVISHMNSSDTIYELPSSTLICHLSNIIIFLLSGYSNVTTVFHYEGFSVHDHASNLIIKKNPCNLLGNRLFQITNLMRNSFIFQQYVCYTMLLNMFRAARCPSSGGPIVSPQPLVSSPSISSRTVCRWRADWSPLSTCIL